LTYEVKVLDMCILITILAHDLDKVMISARRRHSVGWAHEWIALRVKANRFDHVSSAVIGLNPSCSAPNLLP